jgi:electron transfer flavoprotein alpha subunit
MTDLGASECEVSGAIAPLNSHSSAVLCLLERDADGIAAGSLRALGFARSLAGSGGRLTAVVFGLPGAGPVIGDATVADATVAEAAVAGATELCVVSAEGLAGYAPVAWARALEQLAAEQTSAVVAAATDHGSEVMAHLGALTGLPVAANCIAASAAGPGSWQLVRQRWAGSVLEDAVLEASCALLTVAADAVPADAVPADIAPANTVPAGAVPADAVPADPLRADTVPADTGLAASSDSAGARPPVRTFVPVLADDDLRVVATESAEQTAGVSLATARVVVGGGRGVGGPEGFAALEELAGLLGGVVGVSRVVTSQGWRPHRQQVGQTGTKISPELYLACGISGAIQHMAGCLSAKHIVAVNTDPEAPIISRAEYAVIGDLNEVIPALVAAIRSADGTDG